MIERYIREDLRNWENYQVQPVTGRKMDANESPFPLDQSVRDMLSAWILEKEDLRLYPDTDNTVLREAIAAYYGLSPENVTCGVGSDQLIDYLTKLFLEPGETILVPSPSFSMYQTAAEINHGKAVSFPLEPENDFQFSAEMILKSLKEVRPKILFLCSPNNPTGQGLKREDLLSILSKAGCVVVLDEAYGEFAENETLDLISRFPNLVSLRTFSKAYGLAGLRVGYALADPEMIRAIDRVRAPYNLNTFSQIAASCVIGRAEYKEHIRTIISERDRMYKALGALEGIKGFHCYPSQANYLFMRSDLPDLGARLLEKGLLVRAYGGKMSAYPRVSVSDPETNTLFLEAIKEILLP